MGGRNGQAHLSTYVPEELAAAFKLVARSTDGGTAGLLRRLIAEAVDHAKPDQALHSAKPARALIAPRGVGHGKQIGFRLRPTERAMLDRAARVAGTTPANWVRSLALVHLAHCPQWNATELEALRDLFRELRVIGNNVNQIAHAMNAAMHTGRYPPAQGDAVREATDQVKVEMRRIVAVMTGNFDYWGLPDAERPTSTPQAVQQANVAARAADEKRKNRARKRPPRFADKP